MFENKKVIVILIMAIIIFISSIFIIKTKNNVNNTFNNIISEPSVEEVVTIDIDDVPVSIPADPEEMLEEEWEIVEPMIIS